MAAGAGPRSVQPFDDVIVFFGRFRKRAPIDRGEAELDQILGDEQHPLPSAAEE